MDISREKLIVVIFLFLIINSCNNSKKKVEYYENGAIKSFIEEIGEGQGIQYHYDSSGELRSKLILKSGELDGISEYFDARGNLERKVEWKNGNQNGLVEQYYENGRLFLKEYFENGIRVGEREVFSPNGYLIEKEIYDSLGNSIFVYAWQGNGEKLFSSVVPIVTLSKDTVNVNEEVILSVKFAFALSGSMDIEFSEVNSTDMPLVEVLLDSPKFNYVFKFKFPSPGNQKFIVIPHHKPAAGDTLTADSTGKEVSIYVKPNDEV